MPRHPPCALHSLSHTPPTQPPHQTPQHTGNPAPGTRQAMHTLHKKHDTPQRTTHTRHNHSGHATTNKTIRPTTHPPKHKGNTGLQDARVHYPDLKQQPHTTPTTTHTGHTPASRVRRGTEAQPHPTAVPPAHAGTSASRAAGRLILQNPNSVSVRPRHAGRHCRPPTTGTTSPEHGRARVVCFHIFQRHHQRQDTNGHWSGCVLLRKEVIQPHLPVRLPCYDFVPIASPTFDHSLR